MEFKTELQGDKVILVPEFTELEGLNATRFKEKVVSFSKDGHQKIIANFSNIQFVDSSGLGALVSSLKTVHSQSGDLVICKVQPNVYSLFELTRLNRVFKIFQDVDEAIKNFS